ncbi:MAG: hypothetical protein WBM45_13930 [Woeseiaceae bacterium]|jgi:hypothetical protein
MRTQTFTTVLAAAVLAVAAPSFADHNSKNGEGTANMPNDIHNTRVDTLETNDNEAFRDFVKYGEGSTTVNRFESDETQPNQANERQGEANAAMNKGESPTKNQNRVETSTRNQDRARVETRTRLQPGAADRPRRDPDARSTRNRDRSDRGRNR